jgi:ureidoacrylate peracid hydrolase
MAENGGAASLRDAHIYSLPGDKEGHAVDDRFREWSDLLDPRQTAVLAVDVQKFFTRARPAPMFPPLEDVLPRLRRFLDRTADAGVLVVRVQVVIGEETYSEVWRRQFRAGWGSESPLGPGEEGTAFHPGFEPRPGDLHVTKHRYSAFFGTTLDSILRARGIRTVVVAGLTTDVCVSSTARDAFQREYHVITLADCTAELTQERHESGLQTLAANFGNVCTSDDVVQRWGPQPVSVRG